MKKRWWFIDQNDLFFNKKLLPLLDKTKFRKFKPSYILIYSLCFLTLYIPYKFYNSYFKRQITIKYNYQLTQNQQ